MSTTQANGEDLFDQLVKQELDKTLEIIKNNNAIFIGVDTLPSLNEEQKNMFVVLVKQYYGKFVQSLNNQTNESLIKYDPSTRNFIIPVVEDNLDGTTKTVNYNLTVEQFIETIIRAIIIAVFKLDGKHFFTTSLDNTSALINDKSLKKVYPFILSFVLNEMLRDPNFASGLTVLADNVATGQNTVRSQSYTVSGEKPVPETPRNGWPSDRRGGKTNRKRKYKSNIKSRSRSRSSSSSKKRHYKSRKHRRSRSRRQN